MNYRKQGLKALGLSFLAVLGLMAFAASGAQASGTVLVLNKEKTALLTPPFTASFTAAGENTLTSKLLILNLNMEIFCHAASASGSISDTGTGTATIEFTKCLAQGVSGGALSGAVCEIPNIVAKTKVLVILHEGNVKLTTSEHNQLKGAPYLLFTPLDLLTFAQVLNHTECALPEIANVKGSVVASIDNLNYELTHLISTKNMLTLFGSTLTYGANEAHLDVDALVQLVTDELWAVH